MDTLLFIFTVWAAPRNRSEPATGEVHEIRNLRRRRWIGVWAREAHRVITPGAAEGKRDWERGISPRGRTMIAVAWLVVVVVANAMNAKAACIDEGKFEVILFVIAGSIPQLGRRGWDEWGWVGIEILGLLCRVFLRVVVVVLKANFIYAHANARFESDG